MCMKELSLMLTMLIPGLKHLHRTLIVYLQPLIKELQELWKGVWTKDAATGTHFQMKAALLWTINDFPARSSLSGWSGQGYYACPTCNVDTPSMAFKKNRFMLVIDDSLRTRQSQRSKFKGITMVQKERHLNLEENRPDNVGNVIFPRGLITSINSESTEVDASPVNDEKANAKEGQAEDYCLCTYAVAYFLDHTGGMAGGSPPKTAQQARRNCLLGEIVGTSCALRCGKKMPEAYKAIFSLLLRAISTSPLGTIIGEKW
ncbi:hypothetical protein Tco_0700449 [Tanacetum coccineum]